MNQLDAIVPAGGRLPADFAKTVGVPAKALIKVQGVPVIQRTCEILRKCPSIRRIVVVGGPEVEAALPAGLADAVLPEGTSGPDNIQQAVRWYYQSVDDPVKLFIITCDLPFVTVAGIEAFIASAPKDADIAAPLIESEDYMDAYPNSDALFVKLAGGAFTLGCAYVIDVKAYEKARPHLERVFERRKSKLGMARLLGPGFVYKWLMRNLSVADIEAKVAEVLHCRPKAVPGSPPELGFDIDYPDDYHYMMSVFKDLEAKAHPHEHRHEAEAEPQPKP